MICCDTSFLYSFYGSDAHSPQAVAILHSIRKPVSISELNRYEVQNALRLAFFRKFLSIDQRDLFLVQMERDIRKGLLSLELINLADVLAEAGRLSEAYTPSGGHRGFDILHVATANLLGATEFLTFDKNQQKLARAAGMKVPV